MKTTQASDFIEKIEPSYITGSSLKGETVDPELYRCYAKVVKTPKDVIRYYIKACKGYFFSPNNGNQWGKEDAKRVDGATGRPAWEFIKVNKTTFDLYLRFLKTGNEVHLELANREYRNAN